MKLINFMPGSDIFNYWKGVDLMMGDLLVSGLGELSRSSTYVPDMNIEENNKGFNVSIDIPGVSKDQVSLTYSKGKLTVSGNRTLNHEKNKNNYIFNDSQYGAFRRSFDLKAEVDHNKIKASFLDGVLNIFLPKCKRAKPLVKEISIN